MKKFTKEHTKVVLRMSKSISIVLVFTLIFLTSCKGQSLNVTSNFTDMELILQDNYGGSEEEELLVIKNQQMLNDYFGILNRTRKPGFPIPKVDFSKKIIVIWSPGENNSDSNLKIKSSNSDSLLLQKIIVKKDGATTAITRPVYVYKLPNENETIKIE